MFRYFHVRNGYSRQKRFEIWEIVQDCGISLIRLYYNLQMQTSRLNPPCDYSTHKRRTRWHETWIETRLSNRFCSSRNVDGQYGRLWKGAQVDFARPNSCGTDIWIRFSRRAWHQSNFIRMLAIKNCQDIGWKGDLWNPNRLQNDSVAKRHGCKTTRLKMDRTDIGAFM